MATLLFHIEDNPEGWGPTALPAQFKDVPYYAPFNKGDKVGRAADWQQQAYQKVNRGYPGKEKEGVSTIFSWQYTEDDSSFQLVDNQKATPRRFGRRFQGRGFAQNLQRQHRGIPAPQRGRQQQPRRHQTLQNRWQQGGNRGRWGQQDQNQRKREPCIEIKEDWRELDTFDFPALSKITIDKEPQPEDLKTCGSLEAWDKLYDRVSSRNDKPLERTDRSFFNVTTSEDPVIRELAKSGAGNVFATDAILSHVMASTRSFYPWDIVITKKGRNLFLDKRDASQLDFLTVNETALEPPVEDPRDTINSPSALAKEATFINQQFSQQVLIKDKKAMTFTDPNPFQSGEAVSSTGYKYRKWVLPGGIQLVARTEIDGVSPNEDNFLTIKALNEFDLKASDWRKTIDAQKGAVLATELKNNANKLAKWTIQALLAGTSNIRLGYVSRLSPKDSFNHVILGTQDYKAREFAAQINLNVRNVWGVLHRILSACLAQKEDGMYVLVRDHEKNVLRLYGLPETNLVGFKAQVSAMRLAAETPQPQ